MEIEDVLGNRLRLKILKILSHVRELNVSEIARKLDANHKTVKHHLKVLEEAGILQHKRFGRIHLYRLNEASEKARTVKMLIESWGTSKNVN
ncbi:MAG: winged helix-turn-helix domain-containing protein [Candidatus Bathyarchaeia archaeon]